MRDPNNCLCRFTPLKSSGYFFAKSSKNKNSTSQKCTKTLAGWIPRYVFNGFKDTFYMFYI